jgi:SanA protein
VKEEIKKRNRLSFKRWLVYSVLTAFVLYILFAPLMVVLSGRKSVYLKGSEIEGLNVAIVLGAGVAPDGKPRDMLTDRLDVAADAYWDGYLEKILVSGDNREENYNEPQAMQQYLIIQRAIPEEDIILDYAGRRTYDTCARAASVFELEEVLLISQGYHLSRAIFLCENLGVHVNGLSATRSDDYEAETWYKTREFFAIHKALWDIYFVSPDYVGGDAIDIWE